MNGRERLRLFCALRLPPDTLLQLTLWQARMLGGGGRIVGRESLHVTLAFLGSRPASELPAIAGALRAAAAGLEPPRLRVRGYRETRTVGMLVLDDEGGRAGALAAQLGEALRPLGLAEREARPWLAHLTVLRFRMRPYLRPELPELGEISPSDAAVFLSRLRPGGAAYEALEAVPLGG